MRRLAARAAALPPRAQDLALALTLAVCYVGSLIPEAGKIGLPGLAFALVVLEALPLIWRRRWPVATFLICGIPRAIYDNLGIGYAPLPLASMICFYTVMDRSSTRVRWVVGAVALFGLIQGQTTPGHTEPYDFFVAALEIAAAGIAGLASRNRRAYLREVEARAEQEKAEGDRQVALAAAQERTRIARELHDVVAHHVSLMAVQSEAAASLLPGRPAEAAKAVHIIGQTAREALTELRRLLGVLRGPPDVPGLAGSGGLGGRGASMAPAPSIGEIGKLLAQVRKAGIAVDLQVEGSPDKVPPGVDLTAYRIVQEALTNTVKHSVASQATVTLSYEPGYLTVSVIETARGPAAVDVSAREPVGAAVGANLATAAGLTGAVGPDGRPDGRAGTSQGRAGTSQGRAGTSQGRAGTPDGSSGWQAGSGGSGGFGLAGIVERVASCGGSLTLGPGETGGFAVKATLPVS